MLTNIHTLVSSCTPFPNLYLKALPAFCPILVSICDLEKSSYLPQCVSEIVLKLIKIRRDTFKKAPQRYSEDYYPYEKTGIFTEDPTQYYPLHPIMRYPKRYAVSGKVDDDHCDKNFPSSSSLGRHERFHTGL